MTEFLSHLALRAALLPATPSLMSDAAAIVLYTGAAVFFALHVLYFYFVVRKRASRRSDRTQWLALHGTFVSGLTACLYLWIAGSGDASYRWLVYSLCSPILVLSTFELLVSEDDNRRKPYPVELYGSLIATSITVSSGFFISAPALPIEARWIGFIAALGPFIAIPLLLRAALLTRERSPVYSSAIAYIVFTALVWFAYPVGFILSPTLTNAVSTSTESIIYVCADVFTKIIYGLVVTFGYRN